MSAFAARRYVASPSGQLAASRCRVCGRFACPPRLAHCDLPEELVELAPDGQIEIFSDVQVAPPVVARLRGSAATSQDPAGTLVRLAVDVPAFGGARPLWSRQREAPNEPNRHCRHWKHDFRRPRSGINQGASLVC